MTDDPLWTPQQAGEYLTLSVPALAQLRYMGTGPRYIKLTAKAVRYRKTDIDQWVEDRARDRT